ncbi:MAG: ribonuclease J [Patescibacteria group bacterium]|nr:ribonuclease J [Patescibacteria group bacterium]
MKLEMKERNLIRGKLKFIPLGGNGQVTKNMFVYEYENDIIIVDCGMGFPDETMFGIDMVIPDISYLRDKKQKIRGVLITHGHEDHIGALPYILPELSVPVYATKLTAGLINVKLKEHNLQQMMKVNVIEPGQRIQLGSFQAEAFRVSHSIPDAVGYALSTPLGTTVHTGDYKFDMTPVDEKPTDTAKLAELGRRGVMALMSDSLRSEKLGFTLSESMIEPKFEEAMEEATGRVIITTFSSNISRVKQAIGASMRFGRKVALVGRSMESNLIVARELGYIKFPNDILVRIENIEKQPPSKLTLIVAGSQAQSGSALTRIANGAHKFVSIHPGDLVIFSADPIPGHEDPVHEVVDNLTRLGARVIYSDITDEFHVSGHGAQAELMLMLNLTKPRYLVPISGMYRQMKRFADLATNAGVDSKNIFILEEGNVLEFTKDGAKLDGEVETSNVMVDGLGVGDVGDVVLRDRRVLAEEGVVVVIVTIKKSTGEVVGEPDIVSRGFVYMKEAEPLISEVKELVKKSVPAGKVSNWHFVREKIIDSLEKFLYQKTQRRPMVLTVVVEV